MRELLRDALLELAHSATVDVRSGAEQEGVLSWVSAACLRKPRNVSSAECPQLSVRSLTGNQGKTAAQPGCSSCDISFGALGLRLSAPNSLTYLPELQRGSSLGFADPHPWITSVTSNEYH
jgi:hypothetical protein